MFCNIGSWVTECCGLRGHDLVGQVALLMLGLGAWVTQQLFLVLGWAHRLTPSLCILWVGRWVVFFLNQGGSGSIIIAPHILIAKLSNSIIILMKVILF